MQSQAIITAAIQQTPQDLKAANFTDVVERTLTHWLDQAKDDKDMFRLCANFHTMANKKTIKALDQFTNLHKARILVAANEKSQFPLKLFDYLQRRCPSLLRHSMFKEALDQLLQMGVANTTEKVQLVAGIKYPNISNELGIEFVLEDFPQPIMDEKRRLEVFNTVISLPSPLATMIADYDSDSQHYEVKLAKRNGQDCLPWRKMTACYDLQYLLTNYPAKHVKNPVPIAFGSLTTFRDDPDQFSTTMEGTIYGDCTLFLNCLTKNLLWQHFLNVLDALTQRKQITCEKIYDKPLHEIGEEFLHDVVVIQNTDTNKATVFLRTVQGMACGINALAHLRLIDKNDLLPFQLHVMNTKHILSEEKKCYTAKDFIKMLTPLRNLAKKSRIQLPFAKKPAPEAVRKIAERIVILLEASAVPKGKLVSMSHRRVKKVVLHVLDTSPDKDQTLVNANFHKALEPFKLNLPMMQEKKPIAEVKGQSMVIQVQSKASG